MLLAKCVGLLHQERATRLDCGYRTADRTLEVRTSGLKQLDIEVDDQWLPSRRIDDGEREDDAPTARSTWRYSAGRASV